jgi:enoyl-CoA hydratase
MSDSVLLSSDQDGVRLLTLNRPQRRNALDTPLALALLQAIRDADADVSVRAVVVTGVGTVFCAGADLGEFKGERADPEALARRSDLMAELLLAFGAAPVPIVLGVQGHAIGLGAALVNVADMVVLAESARVSYPEVKHGMMPGLIAPVVQAFVPGRKSFELLMLGEGIGGDAALACGLANAVVPDADVLAAALALAARLAALDREVLRGTKAILASMAPMSFPDALRYGREDGRRRARAKQQEQT